MSEQEGPSVISDAFKFVGEIGLKSLQSDLADPNEWPTANAQWDDLGNSSKWSCVRAGMKRIAELEARVAELEGAALKTADGILLTDGMEVWIPNANGVLGGPAEKRVLTTKRLMYNERDAYGRVGARLGCCYSTREAAEAARGKEQP